MDEIRRALLGDRDAEKCDHNATEMRPSFISDHSGGANKMVDHVSDAGKMVDHIPDTTKMMPLTLEQLRQMDGKPVWVQNLEEPEKSQWRLCHWDRGKYLVLQGIYVQGYLEEDYGESWIAYAYPPAHIDLEAWEPCESCISCDNCRNQKDYDPYEGTYGECGQCYGYAHFDPCNFCHECGKPLTPEARAMLEKRLRG